MKDPHDTKMFVSRSMVVFLLVLIHKTQSQSAANDTDEAPKTGFEVAADRLLRSMNLSADPCDNFFDFACGNHKGADDPRTSPSLVKVKRFYDSCERPVAPNPIRQLNLVKEAINALGGWPTVDPNWSESNPNLENLWSYAGQLIVEYGHGAFLESGPVPRETKNVLSFAARQDMHEVEYPTTELGVNATENVLAKLYRSYVIRVFGSADYNETAVQQDAKQVAKIWMKMWKYNQKNTFTAIEYLQNANTLMSISELIQRWPNINWPAFFIAIAEDNTELNAIFGGQISVDEDAVDFINELMESETRRTLQNIMIFSFIDDQSDDLASMKDLTGIIVREPRQCAVEVMTKMPMATSYLFAQRGELARSDLHLLHGFVSTLLYSWRGMLRDTNWLSPESRQAAYGKIETMAQVIGYPDWIFEEGKLDEYYTLLDIQPDDDDFIIVNKVKKWNAAKHLGLIGHDVDRYQFLTSAADIQSGAWYAPMFNSMTIPASNVLNKEYFANSLPLSVNFGKIGTLVGHELGHAFDNTGILYDAYGRYNNDTWMDESSRAGFAKMEECLIEQFNGYCSPHNESSCVNGTVTAGENIADVGGLEAAYRAFKAIESLTGVQPRLSGELSNYNHDQLFFIAYANVWCDSNFVIDPTAVHTPNYYRVNGPLQANADFKRVFECKPGQNMVPDKECKVWISNL